MKINGSESPDRSWAKKIWVALIIISWIRIAPLVVWFDDLQQDPDAYAALAEGWAASGTLGRLSQNEDGRLYVNPTAYRPPLYPYVLSWLTHLDSPKFNAQQQIQPTQLSRFAVALLHWLLGVATCWLTIQIALVVTQHQILSLLAGMCVAVDPILLRQSALVMTETLATFLTVAFWYWWCKTDYKVSSLIIGGVLLGLSVLCRPTAAVWVVTLVIWWVLAFKRVNPIFSMKQVTVLLAAVALTISPWVVRNVVFFGKPIWATTHGGYTLLLANNPLLFNHLREGNFSRNWDEDKFHRRWADRRNGDPTSESFWMSEQQQIEADAPSTSSDQPWRNELKEDQLAHDAAVATIGRHPSEFVLSMLTRIVWLWALWPSATQSGIFSTFMIGLWYTALFVGLPLLAVNHGLPTSKARHYLFPAVLLIASLTLVHSIYWSNMRMRSVALPSVYVMFALLVASRFPMRHRS